MSKRGPQLTDDQIRTYRDQARPESDDALAIRISVECGTDALDRGRILKGILRFKTEQPFAAEARGLAELKADTASMKAARPGRWILLAYNQPAFANTCAAGGASSFASAQALRAYESLSHGKQVVVEEDNSVWVFDASTIREASDLVIVPDSLNLA